MTWPDLSTTPHAATVVGSVRSRGRQVVRRVCLAVYAAAVVGGFGAVLVPWGLTVPWLAALCGVVLTAWLVVGVRSDRRWTGRLELVLDHEPRHLVAHGPWTTRRHPLDEVVAIQLWCDCGTARPSLGPHRDGMDVLLRNGVVFRVEPATAFAPGTGSLLRELLEPSGVRVVDWGGADVDRA